MRRAKVDTIRWASDFDVPLRSAAYRTDFLSERRTCALSPAVAAERTNRLGHLV